MHWIDWTVVAVYVGVLVLITVKARRTRLLEDFTVASRDMPRGMVFATLSATYIGPAYTLGIAGNAAEHGYVWYLISVMVPLQTVLVGCQGRSKFGPLRRSKSRPVGEGVAVFVGRLERSLRSPFRAAQA